MKRSAILAMTMLLAACVQTVWKHTTNSDANYAQDLRECEYDAAKATANIRSGIQAGYEQASLTGMCLEARGYRRVRQQ